MKILAYIITEWDAFAAAIENLIGWHKATGTVPVIPTPPAVGSAPTSPPVVQPPAPAPSATSYPAGVDKVDEHGAVQFLNVSDGLNGRYGGRRYLWMGMLPFLGTDSEAWQNININCATSTTEEHMGALSGGEAMQTVRQPNGGWVVKNPHVMLANTFVIPSEHVTFNSALAYLNALAASNTSPNGGGGPFAPGKP